MDRRTRHRTRRLLLDYGALIALELLAIVAVIAAATVPPSGAP